MNRDLSNIGNGRFWLPIADDCTQLGWLCPLLPPSGRSRFSRRRPAPSARCCAAVRDAGAAGRAAALALRSPMSVLSSTPLAVGFLVALAGFAGVVGAGVLAALMTLWMVALLTLSWAAICGHAAVGRAIGLGRPQVPRYTA